MVNKYISAIGSHSFLLLLLLSQRCAAVVTRDVPSTNVPSELFETVEAPTERPLHIDTVPTSQDQPQLSNTTSLSEQSSKSSMSSHSQTPFTNFDARRRQMSQPIMQQTGGFRQQVPNYIEYGGGESQPFSTFQQRRMPTQSFHMGPQSGGIHHFSGGSFPLPGGGSVSESYYSTSSSSSDGPMGRMGSMGGSMRGPTMSRFSTGPTSMGAFQNGPSGFSSGFGGGPSDNFYRVSSSQTTYDSDVGVPITRNFEYDSRLGGGFFQRK